MIRFETMQDHEKESERRLSAVVDRMEVCSMYKLHTHVQVESQVGR